MSNEVLIKNGNRAEWGADSAPIDPERLPEGYPYDMRTIIYWDGVTEGKELVNDIWLKVSDKTPTIDELVNISCVFPDYNQSLPLYLTEIEGGRIALSTKESGENPFYMIGNTDPLKGIFVDSTMRMPIELYFGNFKKMDPQFIPMESHSLILKFILADDGTINYVDEGNLKLLAAALAEGKRIVATLFDEIGMPKGVLDFASYDEHGLAFVGRGADYGNTHGGPIVTSQIIHISSNSSDHFDLTDCSYRYYSTPGNKLVLQSSSSHKLFNINIDDSGTLSASEITT